MSYYLTISIAIAVFDIGCLDSSVIIVTRYDLHNSGLEFRQVQGDFFYLENVQTGSGENPAFH